MASAGAKPDSKKRDEPAQDSVSVRIPKRTAERVVKRLPDSGFVTIDDYISYVLGEVLNDLEGGTPSAPASGATSFTREEQEAVEQKLRELGYL